MTQQPNDKTRWLAEIFENLGETFEKFNPAAFKFLAAVLPYSTPFPVAWLTMRSAEVFLDFDPLVAFIFVFGLEGMGLWFTSLFVDSIIDVIRSRNSKTLALVALFGAVVTAYVFLLVNLNVTLKVSSGDTNPALERVITLLCFLPLLTGVGNGYYKWKLEQDKKSEETLIRKETTEREIRHEKNELKLKKAMLEKGMNPLAPVTQYQSSTPSLIQEPKPKKKGDWRLLTPQEKHEVVYVLEVPEIMEKYGIGESTAYLWKSKKSPT